jgi:hypothetical protein
MAAKPQPRANRPNQAQTNTTPQRLVILQLTRLKMMSLSWMQQLANIYSGGNLAELMKVRIEVDREGDIDQDLVVKIFDTPRVDRAAFSFSTSYLRVSKITAELQASIKSPRLEDRDNTEEVHLMTEALEKLDRLLEPDSLLGDLYIAALKLDYYRLTKGLLAVTLIEACGDINFDLCKESPYYERVVIVRMYHLLAKQLASEAKVIEVEKTVKEKLPALADALRHHSTTHPPLDGKAMAKAPKRFAKPPVLPLLI